MKMPPKMKCSTLHLMLESLNKPIEFQTEVFKKNGDICYKQPLGLLTNMYFLSHPLYAKVMLEDSKKNYWYRHPPYEKMPGSDLFGDENLFTTTDYKSWQHDRKVITNSFDSGVHFLDYSKTIVHLTQKLLDTWENGYKSGDFFPFREELDSLLLDIMINTFYSKVTLGNLSDASKTCRRTFPSVYKTATHTSFFSLKKRQLENDRAYIHNLIGKCIQERLDHPEEYDDVLSHLLHEYSALPKEEKIARIKSHFITFFAAVMVTTSSWIEWTLVELSRNPEMEQKIYEELEKTVGNRTPTYQDIPSFVYLSYFLKEVLRTHPPIHLTIRHALNEDEINGYRIKKDAQMYLLVSNIHRHPEFWKNPDTFDPLRFKDHPFGQETPSAYVPFGTGERTCIGRDFAFLEMHLIIPMILQKFRLRPPPGSKITSQLSLALGNRPSINHMILEHLY